MSHPERTQVARAAAEQALVRVVHHYGTTPEFVVLGGLVPQLLCSASGVLHAGTADIDAQVDLEIAKGSTQTARLERALRDAEFEPASSLIWRWETVADGVAAVVRFEILADLPDKPGAAEIAFDDCDSLGAVNLRGTGFAARDFERRVLTGRIGEVQTSVEVNVAGLAGFLLAKVAAARERRKPKDWYDIAFVLLHNDAGGVGEAAQRVLATFDTVDLRSVAIGIRDLAANFADGSAQGSRAYAEQMVIDDPALDTTTIAADGVLAVETFCDARLADLAPEGHSPETSHDQQRERRPGDICVEPPQERDPSSPPRQPGAMETTHSDECICVSPAIAPSARLVRSRWSVGLSCPRRQFGGHQCAPPLALCDGGPAPLALVPAAAIRRRTSARRRWRCVTAGQRRSVFAAWPSCYLA